MPGLVPPVADEREGLLAFLAHQRQVLKLAAYGLTDDQARLAATAGPLSVGGLIKHCAATETHWIDILLQRPAMGVPQDYAATFQLADDETLAGVIERYDAVATATAAAVALIPDLDDPVPVPKGVPWFPADVDAWSVCWVLLHLIEETARHAGHADIVRESIDGATAFPLMAAAEGWPETPWMKPWRPQRPPVSML
ncbi:hypothetical protein Cs7R123_69260 [Catellatospora sp. TT07R-123]|uniref:DinB family protein n=1 Tax=Catellatospora sp. TT07R-123 TaxID=2733863 RepID=UPI001B13D5EE|nr:DinB family protein [Catellatospora sp. TT07R-123]GHJ49584.1 hypothetical protein Cs7R123_69260 [Catellatospora sp. TT07R-123]